jgi:UDP-N-acetyl-D-mannosaminuronic acid dehydrogenase
MSQFLERDDRSAERQSAFENGEVPVAVYGLGKMGLPLAAVYAEVTGNVTGVDIDESVVERIRNGECPVEREPGLPELVAELVEHVARQGDMGGDDGAETAAPPRYFLERHGVGVVVQSRAAVLLRDGHPHQP